MFLCLVPVESRLRAWTVKNSISYGTQTKITAFNPFFVINGVGYRTKYEPCNALNSYANRLLNERDAMIILEKPPSLDCADLLLQFETTETNAFLRFAEEFDTIQGVRC